MGRVISGPRRGWRLPMLLAIVAVGTFAAATAPPAFAGPLNDHYKCEWVNATELGCLDRGSGTYWSCTLGSSGWMCDYIMGPKPKPGDRQILEGLLWTDPVDIPPDPQPPDQATGLSCLASWTVSEAESATQALTVSVSFGDGTSATYAIPQGTGIYTFYPEHMFAGYPTGKTYYQTWKTVDALGNVGATSTITDVIHGM